MFYMYSIYDRCAGVYGQPVFCHNDMVAKRDFTRFCQSEQAAFMSADLQLYKVGSFDSDTGEVVPCKPELVSSGVVEEVSSNGEA